MPLHGYASIQQGRARARRTCAPPFISKTGPPEDDAERGTEGRVFETMETMETRTSLPRSLRAREGMTVSPITQGGKKLF